MGRASSLKYTEIWVLGGSWWVPGIVPLQPTPVPPHPGYTPAPHIAGPGMLHGLHAVSGQRNTAVGLISVDQLSLYGLFSDIRTITEVYNLVRIGDR